MADNPSVSASGGVEDQHLHAFEAQKAVIIEALRRMSPDLIGSLEQIELNLNKYRSIDKTEYAQYKPVIGAITRFLQKTGRCATGKEIVEAVVAGGGGRTKRGRSPEVNVLGSIRAQLRYSESNRLIRRMGGGNDPESALVGLYEWEEGHA